MADIDALSIRIEADAKNATRNVNRLANALTKLSEALNRIDPSKLNSAAMAANTMSVAVAGMKSSGKTINSVATAMTKIGEQGANIAQASSSTKDMSNSVEGFAKTSENAATATKKVADGTKELGNSSTRANQVVKALSAGFKGFSNTLKSVGTWFKKTASHALKAATSIKLFGKSAKGSRKSASNLLKEITRIGKMLKLMLTRMVLRQVISGIGDGFKNLAQYSKTFDASLSMLWNDFRQLGNSIAAAASPLLNVFAPALHAIIQLVIQAVNAINQLLSALTGLTSFVRAKKLTDSYAGSLKKAGGAAKELKKTVLGFDELNQLQDNKDSGGGGTSPLDMFEDAPISDKWKEWAKKLKDMWKKGDFTDLGKAIGEWLLNALNKIPWSKIYRTAAKIGKSLATLINGFVEVPELGYTMGKSLAKAVNTAFYFLDDFVRNLHWKSIGQFIGESLNGFFENIKWNKIYDTVYYGVRGIASAIQEAIDTFHWDNISKTLINGLDVISMGIKEFFEGIDWGDLGGKMGDQLAKTLRDADWQQVGEAIGSAIQAAIDWVAGFIDKIKADDVVKALSDFLSGIFEKVDPQKAGETLGKILQLLIDTIKGFWEENHDDIKEAVKNFFSGLFSKVNKVDLMKIVAGILGFAMLNGVTSLTITAAKIALGEKIKSLVTGAGASAAASQAADTAGAGLGAKFIKGFRFGLFNAVSTIGIVETFKGLLEQNKKVSDLDFMNEYAKSVNHTAEETARYNEILKQQRDTEEENAQRRQKTVEVLKACTDGLKYLRDEIGLGRDSMEVATTQANALGDSVKNVSNSFGIADTKAAEAFANMKKNAEKSSDSFGILDTKAATAFKNMQSSCDSLKSSTGNLAVSVQKDTGSIGSSVGIADTKAAQAFRNMQKNANTVTFKPLSDNISTNTTASTNAIHIFDTKAEQSFKNMGKSASDLEITIETESHGMDVAMASAQQSMSGTVKTLSADFGTNMTDIQKTVADSTADINSSLDTVKDGMSEDKWTFSGVWEGLTKTFEKAKEGIKGVWNSIADKLNGSHQIFGSSFSIDLPRFANGGFPENGLFMANSTEMVGKFSNGKNAVANNEQITEGIARAVFNAMTTAQSNSGGQYINNTIMVDGDVIARAVTKGQERLNRRYSPTMA